MKNKNKYEVVMKGGGMGREIVEAAMFDWTVASVEFSTEVGKLVAAFNVDDVSYVIPYKEKE